jgi:Protein of unknown function (DUF2914)
VIKKGKELYAWFQRNERHLSAPIFVAGFVTDLFTVAPLSILYAVELYGLYLVIAALATIGGHYLHVHDPEEGVVLRSTRVVLSLVAQFTTGGLLSGCLIFYTKSAALSASWPFVLLLIAVFVGNEAFRYYREELAFRSILFFFALYAYVIFALPTLLHTINQQTFIESTVIALVVFLVFLGGLALAGWRGLAASFREIGIGVIVTALLVSVSYFTGVIPPLPLSLADSGVYHSVTHTAQGYVVQTEPYTDPWWDIGGFASQTVHIAQGEPLSVFSAVFAPTSFSTAIVHRWQEYDPAKHVWVTKAVIAFAITGGRDDGYRGYSTLSGLSAGKYRVSIETLSGQVIGQVHFTVQVVPVDPPLSTETH